MSAPGVVARGLGLVACLLGAVASGAAAQQIPDTAFHLDTGPAAYPPGEGPLVVIDGAHNNFHTVDGGYTTFAGVLRRDGFRVRGLEEPLTPASLQSVHVLVIANALADDDLGGWVLPNPSAFTSEEIASVRAWVEAGGSLFLIADHMPFPGAAGELAAAFDVGLLNGFAMVPGPQGPIVFRKRDGTLTEHALTEGVDSVATFTGSAMEAPEDATPLLELPAGTVSMNPDTAWAFHAGTPTTDVSGWPQGLVRRPGRGRLAVFGEAAMFSAQLGGPQRVPVGMNAPLGAGNARFLVNLVRWLAGEGSIESRIQTAEPRDDSDEAHHVPPVRVRGTVATDGSPFPAPPP